MKLLFKVEYELVSDLDDKVLEVIESHLNEDGRLYLDKETKEEILTELNRRKDIDKEYIDMFKELEEDKDYEISY